MRANNTQRAAISAIAVAIELGNSTVPTGHADEHDDAFIRALEVME
jgi:hypothetical protein